MRAVPCVIGIPVAIVALTFHVRRHNWKKERQKASGSPMGYEEQQLHYGLENLLNVEQVRTLWFKRSLVFINYNLPDYHHDSQQ